MPLSEKAPERLVLVSLFFSAFNFTLEGVNAASLLLFAAFTVTVYACVKLQVLLQRPSLTTAQDGTELRTWLGLLALVFISIATFSYSWVFGAFFAMVIVVYRISPYDRAWLTGKAQIVVHGNRVEYREV